MLGFGCLEDYKLTNGSGMSITFFILRSERKILSKSGFLVRRICMYGFRQNLGLLHQKLANFFHKGPSSKYFSLCGLYNFPAVLENSVVIMRKYSWAIWKQIARLRSNKTLCMKTSNRMDLAHRLQFASLWCLFSTKSRVVSFRRYFLTVRVVKK